MQRSDIRHAIDFRGLIRGCPDHQWLIADAIWEVCSGPQRGRWWVSTDERIARARPSRSERGEVRPSIVRRRVVTIRDRWTGWQAQADSAAEIAECIRSAFADGTAPPAPEDRGDGARHRPVPLPGPVRSPRA
jgi:hypothetical protein